MKKFAAILLTFLMAVSLVACAGNREPAETSSPDVESSVSEEISASESSAGESEPESEAAQSDETEETESVPKADTGAEGIKVLVAYFSATNTTEGVAEHIANGLNADLYEIVPEEPYTDADLDYNANNSRSTLEMNDPSARPAISGSVENMEQYDIVFIGYPNWWASIPMPIASFLEEYDFSGKTIIPFCSHGGGRFGQSLTAIAKLTPDADMGEALSIHYSGGGSLPEDIAEWLETNGILE